MNREQVERFIESQVPATFAKAVLERFETQARQQVGLAFDRIIAEAFRQACNVGLENELHGMVRGLVEEELERRRESLPADIRKRFDEATGRSWHGPLSDDRLKKAVEEAVAKVAQQEAERIIRERWGKVVDNDPATRTAGL